MKISTIFAAAAVVVFGMSAQAAEENMLRGALEGVTGNLAGTESQLVQNGWQLWQCHYQYVDEEAIPEEPVNDTENWPANVRLESQLSEGDVTISFDGNGATLRWDSGDAHCRWYTLPVNIEKTGIYEFKMSGCEWNNYNGGESNFKDGNDQAWVKPMGIQVLFGTKPGPEGVKTMDYTEVSDYDYENFLVWPVEGSGQFCEMEHRVSHDYTIELEATEAGEHYISFVGPHAMFFIGNLNLKLIQETEPGAGVAETFTDANVLSTSYYGLDGVEVANPAKGSIVIVKNVLDNGKVSVAKKVVR